MPDDLASLDFCHLTTTGRVTGNPHRIEIWFVLVDDTLYLMAGGRDRSDWVRNIMASPEVELELGGRKRSTTARLVEVGAEEDALARRAMLEKYARREGDLTEWGREALVVAVAWPGGVSYTSLV
jgi:deazaflavin-dependent oxidoreductase (nitroreductase family)